ncbi:DNA polymerase ligase N-terminal domain-containing protein [Cellulomonas humilata]|uniref:Bifunctional non-homologous end joining protein LigD n=1 Tax=Cellulomonas humilata TaxID=144055 RepID=A0ABU0EI92_9CELL|nr:DNA polymerase ligase N-terminal domain-containing protein [Cellulomonas humilata]MDQ0374770.1 bifunctional non-homologous end joining protein LigD [Cellulomonas humilata]
MPDSERLAAYRAKRDPARTPEPVPDTDPDPSTAEGRTFVIQEHHARALHWDFRLERDGVLVSWAVPKGLPPDPKANHLAVHTEDHPLEYATFEGTIGEGEYGGGQVTVWDHGTYEELKWTDREVQVVLHGERVQGRYVLFATRSKGAPDDGRSWMVHRMDPPTDPDWTPLPTHVLPMLARPGDLPPDDGTWAYEMAWDGVRVLALVDGGRVRLRSGDDDLTGAYPELAGLGEQLGSTVVALDGELVALDASGAPDHGRLREREGLTGSAARHLARTQPVTYLVYDVLHLDGHPTVERPYDDRRALLDGLGIEGRSWRVPPTFDGPGAAVLAAAAANGFDGIVAKRRSSTYRPGVSSSDWCRVSST